MITRPYSMDVTEAEFSQANAWWRNLSNNQMKELETRHFPNRSFFRKATIHQMWEEESKPEPQALIPIIPE